MGLRLRNRTDIDIATPGKNRLEFSTARKSLKSAALQTDEAFASKQIEPFIVAFQEAITLPGRFLPKKFACAFAMKSIALKACYPVIYWSHFPFRYSRLASQAGMGSHPYTVSLNCLLSVASRPAAGKICEMLFMCRGNLAIAWCASVSALSSLNKASLEFGIHLAN